MRNNVGAPQLRRQDAGGGRARTPGAVAPCFGGERSPGRLGAARRPEGPLRVAVLAKQVPQAEQLRLGVDGRLLRNGIVLEMSPYCRRAVAKGVELAKVSNGTCTVFTLGPPFRRGRPS